MTNVIKSKLRNIGFEIPLNWKCASNESLEPWPNTVHLWWLYLIINQIFLAIIVAEVICQWHVVKPFKVAEKMICISSIIKKIIIAEACYRKLYEILFVLIAVFLFNTNDSNNNILHLSMKQQLWMLSISGWNINSIAMSTFWGAMASSVNETINVKSCQSKFSNYKRRPHRALIGKYLSCCCGNWWRCVLALK